MRERRHSPASKQRFVAWIRVFVLVVAGAIAIGGCGGGQSDSRAAAAASAKAAEEAKAREEADARRERDRLASLWTYTSVPAANGQQVAASIKSANDVDADGKASRSVLLVFRDHPSWGRSSYLVLQSGDFDCYGRCTVKVTADTAAPKPMAARRPKTDEAIAMFIDDERALYRLTTEAKRISIEFPVKAGGTRTASFDVAGLDRSKLAGWDGR
jgi:hypothetical protein